MSSQRYTPEFEQEAVRKVVERGYSVAEVAAKLGVTTHCLYKGQCGHHRPDECMTRFISAINRNIGCKE